MVNKKELRSEKTKKQILTAAQKLFAARGFDAVSMREIAKEAKCSHTTIYIYFEHKEALLQQLSMPPLEELKQQLQRILNQTSETPDQNIKALSKEFIYFCLLNRNMYTIFFHTKAGRVDEKEPKLEINRLRNELFGLLGKGLQECLQIENNNGMLLTFSRVYFFTLQGIIGTYQYSEESFESLMDRLNPTFESAVEVLIAGFKQKINTGGTSDEN